MLFTNIYLLLGSLSALLKHKFLRFVNLSLFLYGVSKICWNIVIFCPNFRDQPWRCTYFGAKLVFKSGLFMNKYPWYMNIHFQVHFFAIWSISASVLSIIAWKAPISSWFPSELAMFLKIDPQCLRPFMFPDCFRFLWIWLHSYSQVHNHSLSLLEIETETVSTITIT